MKTLTNMMKITAILITLLNFVVISIYSQEKVEKSINSQLERFNNKKYDSFRDYIMKNASFPPEAFNYPGVLLTGFTLSADGKLVNVFNLNSLSPTIDNQILDLIESSKGFWSPLPDSISLRKNYVVIIPVVFCLKNTEYNIQKDNFKLKLQKEVVLTALIGQEQMSKPDYTRTINLSKKFEKLLSKAKYLEAYDVIIELLRRDPLNSEFYSKLLSIETSLGNKDIACNYLKFVKTYLIQQPGTEILDKIECK